MKKKILITAAIVICLAILATGTWAYFTTEDTATNVITAGNIDIDLIEMAKNENGKEVPFKDVSGVMPGSVVSKIVTVENTGDYDAFVRIALAKDILLKGEGTEDLSLVTMDINTKDWTEKDGYYYYNSILKPGEVTKPLFTEVSFSKHMDNKYQSATALIDVVAYAVQVANNGTDPLTALGWPAA